ncbi:MAG TPA: glycosyltransferase [Spirochaetota bacterium]|nr:glycosyltransferase [Spirochaetota bacterium]
MRILIVSTYFPPANSIASLRPYSWAKWWSKAGHDVTVLTTEKEMRSNDFKLSCNGFKILTGTVENRLYKDTSFNFKRRVIKRFESFLRFFFNDILNGKGCFGTCRFPDFHDFWAKKSINFVINDNWDLVISTGGPYSVHFVGYAIKKNNPSVKWIVDWRDLWTKNHLFEGFILFRWYERYLEKKFHHTADLITTVSEPLSETLRTMTSTPVLTITNGFDADDFADIVKRPRKINKKFTITYTGSIYRAYQNPEPLFEAVKNLKDKKIITKNDLKIVFAGSPTANMMDTAESYGISDFFSYAGFLPREEVLKMQYDADALLFLEYNNPEVKGVLTGKIFEYLYLGREIWAIGIETDSSAGSLIKETNTGVCFGTDSSKIEKYIVKALTNRNEYKKNWKLIDKFNRKTLALEILDNI